MGWLIVHNTVADELPRQPEPSVDVSRYSWVIPGPVIVVAQGRKAAALKYPWLTMVRMTSFPSLGGSPVIRSLATIWKGLVFGDVGIW
jgi:hypothetical protein